MSSRRLWTENQDRVLRMLFQERQINRWSQLAKVMQREFNIPLRSGKQCRERYFNHLDDTIKRQKWSVQQQQELVDSHNLIGNRWSQISRSIPGRQVIPQPRSQNCVKNKFYSILRKGLRFINMTIKYRLKRYKQIDINVIYKIVEYCQAYYKKQQKSKEMEDMFDLKRQIIKYGLQQFKPDDEDCSLVKVVIEKIKGFLRKIEGKEVKKQIEDIVSIEENRFDLNIQMKEEDNNEIMREIFQQIEKSYSKKSTAALIELPVDEKIKEVEKKKNDSRQSLKSLQLFEMKPFEIPVYDMRSIENLEQQAKTPQLKFFQTPYFDQLRLLGSINSWNQMNAQ